MNGSILVNWTGQSRSTRKQSVLQGTPGYKTLQMSEDTLYSPLHITQEFGGTRGGGRVSFKQ